MTHPHPNVLFRPFKNYSGDISGRFIEIMAMDSGGDLAVHPAFKGLLKAVAQQQRPGGYFCASGVIDWQQPIDHPKKGADALGSRMLPALWGNARLLCDDDGAYGFGHEIEESTWCCTFHGELSFIQLRKHLLSRTDGVLTCNFALDFSAVDPAGTTTSVLRPSQGPAEVLRQRLSLAGQPATVVCVRRPHWADAVTAVDATGAALTLQTDDGWCATAKPLNEVEFIFAGGVYAENRRCTRLPGGPMPGESFVLEYGPKLLAAEGGSESNTLAWPATIGALEKRGLKPMDPELRRKDGRFVMGGRE